MPPYRIMEPFDTQEEFREWLGGVGVGASGKTAVAIARAHRKAEEKRQAQQQEPDPSQPDLSPQGGPRSPKP